MSRSRLPMQVDPDFMVMLKDIQKGLMMELGESISLSNITRELTNTTDKEIVKSKLIERRRNAFDIPIKFHKR